LNPEGFGETVAAKSRILTLNKGAASLKVSSHPLSNYPNAAATILSTGRITVDAREKGIARP
jgi:hypothetical protein